MLVKFGLLVIWLIIQITYYQHNQNITIRITITMLKVIRQLYSSLNHNMINPISLSFCTSKETEQDITKSIVPKQRIKSLQSLIQQKQKNSVQDLFNSKSQRLFQFGMNPIEFRLHYFIYFKQGYWQSNPYAVQKLLNFIKRCDQEESRLQKEQKEQNEARLGLIHNYRRELAGEILPSLISELEYANIYLQQLSKFLEKAKELSEIEVNIILLNFHRIVYGVNEMKYFDNENDNAWLISHSFTIFLDRCLPMVHMLPFSLKSNMISIARSLRIQNMKFLEYLKRDVQKVKKDISLQVFLASLLYLGYYNSFPYEYFYRNKESLMSFIQSAEDLSDKKVLASIYMLQIFSRHRLIYCEKIIQRLLNCIEVNLAASEISQVSRIFFFYSKLKCGTEHSFVLKIVERINLFMDSLDQKHYVLIIKAVANLNYKDDLLIQKLKDYNYELFLSSLKFGCEHLGSYYKAILDQVQSSFRADSTRHYGQQDKPFGQIVEGVVLQQ